MYETISFKSVKQVMEFFSMHFKHEVTALQSNVWSIYIYLWDFTKQKEELER